MTEKSSKIETSMQEIVALLKSNKNLILTGAPGTGKTYLANEIAKAMGATKENGQLQFVQFHPSYDYTDFVEGLRPTPPDENGNIGFELEPGIFKKFCEKALITSEKSRITASWKDKLNDSPVIWKMSLKSSGKNDIREDCLNKNRIRLGYHEFVKYYEKDRLEDSKNIEGYSVVHRFIKELRIGDIVVDFRRNTTTDAIGIVTGNIEILQEDNFKFSRNVEWIAKTDIDNPIKYSETQGANATIHKLKISLSDIERLVNEMQGSKPQEQKGTDTTDDTKFVFIIDEINRGEISKIFGELFFSIDPSYRGEKGKVQTQYTNLIDDGDVFKDGFFVPDNVYIIGTMNDIDRSVESFDFAMRRRFTWKEITAEQSAGNMKLSETTKNRMKSLNDAISAIEGLNSSYHIGGAYFIDKDGKERTDYDEIWKLRLRPLLFEYLRGITDADKKVDEDLQKAYNKTTAVQAEAGNNANEDENNG